MPSDALLRHFLHRVPPAWDLLLQFPFKCLWEVCCSWRAVLQAAGELEGTALLRPAKLSLPFAAARLSRQPLSRSAFHQAAN